jgi:hypothetical protein
MLDTSCDVQNSDLGLADTSNVLGQIPDARVINKIQTSIEGNLDALASLIAHANEARFERLRFQKEADLTNSNIAVTLARLTFLDDEAFVAVRQAIEMAPLSERGRLEAWYLFLANRP